MTKESITLYYREGSSDKVYQAAIVDNDGGYVVHFSYGRRGSTLQNGSKTPVPVPYEAAKKIYDNLVREKMAKGYTPGANGTPYSGTENAQRITGISPQLLNPVDERQVERLLADNEYWMQQKFDGKRVIIQVTGDKIVGINRKGLTIALPDSIVQSAAAIRSPCILDGEAIGDKYYAFDLLSLNGVDCRSLPCSERHEKLFGVVGESIGSIEFVETFCTDGSKSDAFRRLKQANAEGVVFKRKDALYTPGRPASGGPQLKFKFVATGSFLVAGVNSGKRSVGLEVFNESGAARYVGNCTVPPNHKLPAVGATIEARYLYCYREGCLAQPVYLGERDDLDAKDCTTAQLKYRPEENDDGE